MSRPPRSHASAPLVLSRRGFLVGAAGLALAAACGSDDGDGGVASSNTTTEAGPTEYALGVFFAPNGYAHTSGPQRLPFGLFVDGLPAAFDQAPDEITVRLAHESEGPRGGREVSVARHGEGMPRPYYPVTAELDRTGSWFAVTEVDGQPLQAAFAVTEPGEISVLLSGEEAPGIATPTFDDHQGVEPICTREPACPLHDVTLGAALDENRPIAFMVSSPAFCQTAVCGPVLEVLLGEMEGRTDIRFLHAEVYQDPTVREREVTAAMSEMGLTFEPSLFLIGADGVLRERLDFILDATEVRTALDRLTA